MKRSQDSRIAGPLFLLFLGSLLSGVVHPVLADQPDPAYGCHPTVFKGTATWYDNTHLGLSACHYSDPTLPTGTATIDLYAAVATHLYDDGICGACAEVTALGTGRKATVMITDECPAESNQAHCGNGSNHLDLSIDAFRQLEDPKVGVIDITWKVVPCPLRILNVKGQRGSSLTYQFKHGASADWATIIIRDYPMPIRDVRYCRKRGRECSPAVWQRSFNGWVPTGRWSEFFLRLVDKSGHQRDFGPIRCCEPMGTDAKTENATVYARLPGAQMPRCPRSEMGGPWPTATAGPATPADHPRDCPLSLNHCDSLTVNGVWSGSAARRSIENARHASITEGQGALKIVVTVPRSWNDQMAQLTGFVPDNWSGFRRLTFSVFVDPSALPWGEASEYQRLGVFVDASRSGKYETPLTPCQAHCSDRPDFTFPIAPGINRFDIPIVFPGGKGLEPNDVIDKLYIVLNVDEPRPGTLILDELVLHTDSNCPM